MGKNEQRGTPVALTARNQLHLKRKIFHAFNGLLIFTIYQFDCVNWVLGGLMIVPFVLLAWGLEIGRLKSKALNDTIIKYTGQIMRAGEVNKPSGICFFLTGVLIAGILVVPEKNALLMSVLYLGLGDPFASACGILTRPFTPKSLLLSNGKNVIGTLCNIVFCGVLSFVFLTWRFAPFYFTITQFWSLVIGGGIAGGLSELFLFGSFMNTYMNDNLTIPIICTIVLKAISLSTGANLQ
uniref:Dolichol kinase n=1 Tax=Vannella robusta TaxID=1487602 RepID=A0A7S4IUE6_9EUKA|mmetsp:Transcript_8695/g.10751  ORF Transcript_8695/g.10751 Transcript_8695/m.10751 type:complete len:239 (-) Transcript_8695:27-743(-)